MREYFDNKKCKMDYVTISIPYTFRVIPENKYDYVFENAFASTSLYLNLEANFEKALKMAGKHSKE